MSLGWDGSCFFIGVGGLRIVRATMTIVHSDSGDERENKRNTK